MKLSLITINYNNKNELKKTIESVINQTYNDFEYIVIDGGSTDGSAEVIREHAGKIQYWISEPDKGIYNAMNKGIRAAKGEFLLFLNSGDWFCNNEVLDVFTKDIDDYDIIYGDQYGHHPNGQIVADTFPDTITFYYLGYLNSLPHQASLIRRSILEQQGLYDEEMRMNADWKFFMLAIFKYQCKYLHKKMFVVNFNKEGLSSDPAYFYLKEKEKRPVMDKEFSNFVRYEKDMTTINELEFYYRYSRTVRVLKKMGLLKYFNY